MYTQTHTGAHTFSRSPLAQTDTHALTQPHYTPVSLSRCLVGLCSAPAREVKCRRAGPDCTVGGEGDGWLGVVGAAAAVVVWGARERERREGGDLMRNSCPRMEGSGWGFRRGGEASGGGVPAPTLLFCRAQGQGCAGGLGEVRVL